MRAVIAALGVVSSGCVAEIADDDALAFLEPVPTLEPASDLDPDPDVVEIELVASAGAVGLRASQTTSVLGYRDGDGEVSVPGPLIEAKVGDLLRVHFRNELDEPTTVHWHGLRLPAEMDGNPMVSGVVMPGESFEYAFTVADAGTYWYHPHVDTDRQMEMGLSGPLVVRDPQDPTVDAERILFIDDVELDDDGHVVIEPSMEDVVLGRRGNVLLVNGRPPGRVDASAGDHERWRVINGSNGRFLEVELDGLPMTVVAKDGGLVSTPYAVESLAIAPGERYDLLVTMDAIAGEAFEFRTLDVDRGHAGAVDQALTLLWVDVHPGSEPGPGPIFARPLAPIVDEPAELPVRDLVLTSDIESVAGPLFYINDQAWPLNAPVEVGLGDAELWQVHNDGDGEHPFHIHGLFFEVLDVGGVPRPARALEDTVAIGPGETARLAVRYTAPGAWMFHCQIPEHAERGMMGDLIVAP